MITPVYTQLHLGLGSFHRAHQAVYMQALHDQGDKSWQIIGGNIRPDMLDTISALQEQNGAYTLETVSPEGERNYQWITAIKQVITWDDQLHGLSKVAADPHTRIISFTVTEAGYYLDAHHQLDESFADLRHDIAGAHSTIYGALAKLLTARKANNAGAVSLMNCDNLRSNGERFYHGFQQFLEKRGATDLLAWVNQNTNAPNSMVDRITPRPTPDVRARVLEATGRDDPAALMGESFIQWVVEDHFIAGRPAWEKVGVEMVPDVMPYEEAKIRLLNATHSCIAWAGTLRGYTYIHEGTHDPDIRQMAYDYVTNDTIPCLNKPDQPSPVDLPRYRDVVLDRFGNPNVKDTNQRVAMDGFSKIPGFIQPTIRESLAANRSIDSVAMLPALFLAFLKRQQRGEISFQYEDQAMPTAVAQAICSAADPIATFANERLLFGTVAGDERLVAALQKATQRIHDFMSNKA
ncbi:D-arabinitol 4-dehydrogenase [Thiolinea disciformis]|uniref:D-arabinitol 4-dehydrogenase n=1 Tax=Thiolinea disciformis TaxID=125614 RepID=UPI00037063FE|nr:D-arabinitol 4-dehydrogenase [Thiolinea disciformis]